MLVAEAATLAEEAVMLVAEVATPAEEAVMLAEVAAEETAIQAVETETNITLCKNVPWNVSKTPTTGIRR